MQQKLQRAKITLKKQSTITRKQATRTKVQLGGLVIKSGIAEFLSIAPGDDLQNDINKRDAAYALLGMLLTLKEDLTPNQMTYFISKGKWGMHD